MRFGVCGCVWCLVFSVFVFLRLLFCWSVCVRVVRLVGVVLVLVRMFLSLLCCVSVVVVGSILLGTVC